MINKLKNNFFYLLGSLVLGTLIVTFVYIPYNNKHPQQDMNYFHINTDSTTTVRTDDSAANLSDDDSGIILRPEQFHSHVDQLMTHTWNQLEQNAGITLHDCQEFLCEYAPQFKAEIERSNRRKAKKFGALSNKTTHLIHEILTDFNINPASISLVPYNGHGSPAAADDYTIYIDEQNLKTYSPEAQRFVIAHEISHYLHKDHSLESALTNLIEPRNKAQKKCLHSFAHSSEFRADINAMLKGITYTRGGILFFEDLINRYGDEDCSTHPRTSERLKIARDMEAMHLQQGQAYPVGALAA